MKTRIATVFAAVMLMLAGVAMVAQADEGEPPAKACERQQGKACDDHGGNGGGGDDEEECVEDGFQFAPLEGVASGVIHEIEGQLPPEAADAAAGLHTLNCTVVVPAEDAVDGALGDGGGGEQPSCADLDQVDASGQLSAACQQAVDNLPTP